MKTLNWKRRKTKVLIGQHRKMLAWNTWKSWKSYLETVKIIQIVFWIRNPKHWTDCCRRKKTQIKILRNVRKKTFDPSCRPNSPRTRRKLSATGIIITPNKNCVYLWHSPHGGEKGANTLHLNPGRLNMLVLRIFWMFFLICVFQPRYGPKCRPGPATNDILDKLWIPPKPTLKIMRGRGRLTLGTSVLTIENSN